MDFAHVGKHCSMPNCRQQDFLPFQCEFCGDVFCENCRRPDDHKCRAGGYASVDDNFVILCPICNFRISMRGATASAVNKMGSGGPCMTPDELWNKHVNSGECARQQEDNKRNEKPTVCQVPGCNKKMNYISRYQCPKCGIFTCMEHRYDDAHNCGKKSTNVTQQQTRYSKLLQPGYFGNKNQPQAQQQQRQQPRGPPAQTSTALHCLGEGSGGGGYQPLRSQPKPPATNNKPPGAFSTNPPSSSTQANQIPDQLETCPICFAVFRSLELLIEHSMTAHQDGGSGAGRGAAQDKPKAKSSNDTEKCPKCFKRFNVVELVAHMQQEHFIF